MGICGGQDRDDIPPPKVEFSRIDTIFERFRCGLSSCEKMSSQVQIFFEIHPFTFWEKKSFFFPKCEPAGHGAFKEKIFSEGD